MYWSRSEWKTKTVFPVTICLSHCGREKSKEVGKYRRRWCLFGIKSFIVINSLSRKVLLTRSTRSFFSKQSLVEPKPSVCAIFFSSLTRIPSRSSGVARPLSCCPRVSSLFAPNRRLPLCVVFFSRVNCVHPVGCRRLQSAVLIPRAKLLHSQMRIERAVHSGIC